MAKIELIKHIFLIGLPLVGKSSLGREAASLLNVPFIDLDDEIAVIANSSIIKIWTEQGETSFRVLERYCLLKAMGKPPSFVVCGGGTPIFMDNMEVINQHVSIYCHMDIDLFKDRSIENRPILGSQISSGERLKQLEGARESYYKRALYKYNCVQGVEQNVHSFILFLNEKGILKNYS